jgi:hypothetical protein
MIQKMCLGGWFLGASNFVLHDGGVEGSHRMLPHFVREEARLDFLLFLICIALDLERENSLKYFL